MATPVPAECSRPNVVARGEAPKREGGWRPPSVWECHEQLSGCYFDGSACHDCRYGARSPEGVCRCPQLKRNSQGWRSSSDDDDHDSSQRIPRPWISCSSQPPPPPDGVPTTPPARLPPGFQSPPVTTRLTPTVRLLASAQSTAQCGSALMRLMLPAAKMTGTGMTHGVPNSPALQAGTSLSFRTFSLMENRLPNSWNSRRVGFLVLRFVQISAVGVRLTSFRSSPGIMDLPVFLIRARLLRTLMVRGM